MLGTYTHYPPPIWPKEDTMTLKRALQLAAIVANMRTGERDHWKDALQAVADAYLELKERGQRTRALGSRGCSRTKVRSGRPFYPGKPLILKPR